jgi:hypothetical protein
MAEHKSQGSRAATLPTESAPANLRTTRVRSSSFKYYIHDGSGAIRLKLIGEFTQADVDELNGCWRTAKTTLSGRKLILDVESLKLVDEAGRDWLVSMTEQGAFCLPESYLSTCIPGQDAFPLEPAAAKPSLLSRVIALFRGGRVSAAESSRQVQ